MGGWDRERNEIGAYPFYVDGNYNLYRKLISYSSLSGVYLSIDSEGGRTEAIFMNVGGGHSKLASEADIGG